MARNDYAEGVRDERYNTLIEWAFDVNAPTEDFQLDLNGNSMSSLMIPLSNNVSTIEEDMRPINNQKYEYSYRPNEQIVNYWAGPSYWKFKPRNLIICNKNSKKRLCNRRRIDKIPNLFETIDGNVFIPINSKQAKKIRKIKIEEWNGSKLKLPKNHNVDPDLFNYYLYAPGIKLFPLNERNNNSQNASLRYENDQENHYSNDYESDQIEQPVFTEQDVLMNSDLQVNAKYPTEINAVSFYLSIYVYINECMFVYLCIYVFVHGKLELILGK